MRNERLTKADVFGWLKELDRYMPMDGCRERDPGDSRVKGALLF